jgi:uncharacterized membrane-anchored protein
MRKNKKLIILLNLVLLLGFINWSTVKKEQLASEGELILLELAPVDPRSLMQGDYMSLAYAISQDQLPNNSPKRGYFVVSPNEKRIARLVRVQTEKSPLNKGEYLINYTRKDWRVNIGAESYFFEEGQAKKFENAKFGGIKVDNKGNSLLMGLYDEKGKFIEP